MGRIEADALELELCPSSGCSASGGDNLKLDSEGSLILLKVAAVTVQGSSRSRLVRPVDFDPSWRRFWRAASFSAF
jgi:hypothetical protein